MKKIVLIASITLVSSVYSVEPSVYGAGDIDSAEPYGLTTTEKSVLENRRAVQNLKNRVTEQQNRIDGLTTIIEGLNKEILSLKEQLKNPTNSSNQTYNMLLEMGKTVDIINNNYITQEDIKEIMAGGTPIRRATMNNSSVGSSSMDVSTTYRMAVQLFSQRSYQSAKQNFEEALTHNYKPASTNYYLGEVAYYTNEYSDAIAYYKKSASLNDKANYMKVLYLHTGIALARTGQDSKAKGFFQFVIDNYPNTKVAEIAKKNL
jgi:TolA-binding protein